MKHHRNLPTNSNPNEKQRTSIQRVRSKLVSFLLALLITYTSFIIYQKSYPKLAPHLNQLQCVYALQPNVTTEGLGAIVMRNQLATYIASTLDVPLAFTSLPSIHNYSVDSLFSSCNSPSSIPKSCTLDQKKTFLSRCLPGDCLCKQKKVSKILKQIPANCDILAIIPDGDYNAEYSGCLRPLMNRYFGSHHKPKLEYDALHYRMGDLEGVSNKKRFSKLQLFHIIRTMCNLSKRPIVVITQGAHAIPTCDNRIVLAADVSIRESFRIMQYATNVGFSTSSFAYQMMEIATPQRVVLFDFHVPFFEWILCQNWTIIDNHGMVYHFDSKHSMIKNTLERTRLDAGGYGKQRRVNEDFYEEIPKRRWQTEKF